MNPIQGPNSNGALARLLAMYNQNAERALERLATGERINRGADDPAGLIASENFRAILATLEAETRTLQRSDQVAAAADGALTEINNLLNEAEGLLVANANDAGMSDAERQANQMQLDSILSTVDRIATTSTFNGQSLFDGSMTLEANGATVTIDEIGPHVLGHVEIDHETFALDDLESGKALNIVSGDLAEAQETLTAAREQINSLRGRLGAFQKHTIGSRLNEVGQTMQNVAAAESMIRDTDFAKEAADFSRSQTLHDAAMRVAAMTKSDANNVLNLLG